MIKVVFSWKDRPDLSAAECEARYRAVHIPLARAAFEGVEGFRELRFNRVRRETVNDYNRSRAPRGRTRCRRVGRAVLRVGRIDAARVRTAAAR